MEKMKEKRENGKISTHEYPEVQLVQPNEERVQKQIDSLMPWINENIDDGLDEELTEQGLVKKLVPNKK